MRGDFQTLLDLERSYLEEPIEVDEEVRMNHWDEMSDISYNLWKENLRNEI